MMKINPKKTQIMLFQKRARKNADFHFLIDSQIIDVVQEYAYLGTRMSSSGNFQCHVNVSGRKLFMPSSAWDDTPILAN